MKQSSFQYLRLWKRFNELTKSMNVTLLFVKLAYIHNFRSFLRTVCRNREETEKLSDIGLNSRGLHLANALFRLCKLVSYVSSLEI